MTATRVLIGLLLALAILMPEAEAQRVYRWVDDEGNAHYAGTRNDVPERYRSQLPPDAPPVDVPREPARPSRSPERVEPPYVRASRECVLRTVASTRVAGSRRSYPDCDACLRALQDLRAEDTRTMQVPRPDRYCVLRMHDSEPPD
jgi:hypothetical protein